MAEMISRQPAVGDATDGERRFAIWPRLPLRTPEDVFVAWLLWLPADADLQAAARREIARIDAGGSRSPPVRRLRTYLLALTISEP